MKLSNHILLIFLFVICPLSLMANEKSSSQQKRGVASAVPVKVPAGDFYCGMAREGGYGFIGGVNEVLQKYCNPNKGFSVTGPNKDGLVSFCCISNGEPE